MISLYRYYKISELAEMLAAGSGSRDSIAYMLPSRANEDILLDLLCGGDNRGSYFGKKPLVWDWAGMYRAVVPRSALRRQIDPPDHRLILKYAIDRNIEELDRFGVDIPKGVRRRGFVDILSAAVRELLLEDVSPDMLLSGDANGGEESGKSGGISSGVLLYRLYTDYLLYLEEHGLADNSQIPSLIRHSASERDFFEALPERIVWVGFMSLTGSQLKLVRTLAGRGVDMEFFSPDCGLNFFHDIGEQLGLKSRSIPERSLSLRQIAGNSLHEQYEALADEIASIYSSKVFHKSREPHVPHKFPDIGVLLPGGSSGSLRLMASALEARSVPFQSRAETPISETVLIDTVRRVWSCYELGWPFLKTFSLLCTPHLNVQLDRRSVAESKPEGAEQWRRLLSSNKVEIFDKFDKLENFCKFLDDPNGHTAEDLLHALFDLVRGIGGGWDVELSSVAAEYAELDGAVRELASAAVEISEKIEMLSELTPPLGEAGMARFSGSDAAGFLVEWSREATAALGSPQRGAVTLYDSYPPVLVSHDVWAIADVDSSHFPGPAAEHLLLDGEMRSGVNSYGSEGVHLPTLHEKREQSEAVFRRLLATGERLVIVSRSLSDSRRRPQGESPFMISFLAALGKDSKKTEEAEKSGAVLPGRAAVNSIDAECRIERGRFPRVAVSLVDSCDGRGNEQDWQKKQKMRVGASHIDEWLQCPFFYFCARVAKLERPVDTSEVFGRIDQGNLLHEIWRSVWSRYIDAEGVCRKPETSLHGTLLSSWDEIVLRLGNLAISNGLISDPRSLSAISGLKSKMLDMADIFDRIEERASAAGMVRAGIAYELKLPEYELDNAVFVGYADRVDHWAGVGSVIMDYKLGASERFRGSLQLACYSVMMREGGYDVAGYCYAAHGNGKLSGAWRSDIAPIYRKSRGRTAEPEEMVERALSVMGEMDAAIGDGAFPAKYDSPSCPRCPYQTVCRRGERLGVFYEDSEDESGER